MEYKKLTSKSGITIPKQLRLDTGLQPGAAVDIMPDGNGVRITPHVIACRFCGSTEQQEPITTVSGINVCQGCATILIKELKQEYDL